MAKDVQWRELVRATLARDGLFTTAQAGSVGVTLQMVRRAVTRGMVAPVHRGVWHLEATPWSWKARQRAAVLALQGHGCASHAGAAALLSMPGISRGRPEVCRPGLNPPTLAGVRGHASRELEALDITEVEGVATTTGSRTLIDLQPRLTRAQLLAVIDDAVCAGVVSRAHLHARASALALGRSLRTILEVTAPSVDADFWSVLERGFGGVVSASGLSQPAFNVPWRAGGRLLVLDAVWQTQRLVAELHGLRFHSRPSDRLADDERLNLLTLGGYRCLVFTWRDVFDNPQGVVATLDEALRAGSPGGAPA